jgi:hypothetical protein
MNTPLKYGLTEAEWRYMAQRLWVGAGMAELRHCRTGLLDSMRQATEIADEMRANDAGCPQSGTHI